MQDIRVLVADDEIPARGELKYELATIPGVQIVGECKNGKEVLDFLNVHPNVDILFLDIEMPFMNGLECAKEIQRRDYPVKIVFATGYSQFAVQALKNASREPSKDTQTASNSAKTTAPREKSSTPPSASPFRPRTRQS